MVKRGSWGLIVKDHTPAQRGVHSVYREKPLRCTFCIQGEATEGLCDQMYVLETPHMTVYIMDGDKGRLEQEACKEAEMFALIWFWSERSVMRNRGGRKEFESSLRLE